MKTIHKYALALRDPNEFGPIAVIMPSTAKVISAIVQHNDIVLYVAVDKDQPSALKDRLIYIAGTGKELPAEVESQWDFIGTIMQGPYVWHIYAEPAP